MDWQALAIGAVLGAVVAFVLAQGAGANTQGITGQFAAPYQANLDRGTGTRRR